MRLSKEVAEEGDIVVVLDTITYTLTLTISPSRCSLPASLWPDRNEIDR